MQCLDAMVLRAPVALTLELDAQRLGARNPGANPGDAGATPLCQGMACDEVEGWHQVVDLAGQCRRG